MAVTRRMLSNRKIDDYIPQAILCINCQTEVDLTTAVYGRITLSYQSRQDHNVIHTYHGGKVIQTPVCTELFFPVKITGYACLPCYTLLYNTTWRDKTDHLRRAFETVALPIEQPKNDDHDASPITKGLYAPHVVKGGKKGRKADYYEYADPKGNGSPVIDESSLPRNPADDRKLTGFNRPVRDDIKLKPKQTIVKGGRWKVDPTKYDYVGRTKKE